MTIEITRLQLDKEMKLRQPDLHNVDATVYGERRDRALLRALADFQAKYRNANDPFVISDTFDEATPPDTGTVVVSSSVGDIFKIDLLAGAEKVYGNNIWVSSGTELKLAVRQTPDEIVLTGTDADTLAFFEVNGQIQLYVKDAEITAFPADIHYTYYRGLTPPAADADIVPVLPEDIDALITATLGYIQL
jgi:general stress protein 26